MLAVQAVLQALAVSQAESMPVEVVGLPASQALGVSQAESVPVEVVEVVELPALQAARVLAAMVEPAVQRQRQRVRPAQVRPEAPGAMTRWWSTPAARAFREAQQTWSYRATVGTCPECARL